MFLYFRQILDASIKESAVKHLSEVLNFLEEGSELKKGNPVANRMKIIMVCSMFAVATTSLH